MREHQFLTIAVGKDIPQNILPQLHSLYQLKFLSGFLSLQHVSWRQLSMNGDNERYSQTPKYVDERRIFIFVLILPKFPTILLST